MKALVAVKRVLDYNVRVRIKSDHSDVDLNAAKMSMNPFDEIAIEEALRWHEHGVFDEVVAVSIGETQVQDTLRHALALGAHRAIWVEAPSSQSLEPLHVAKILKAIVEREKPELCLLGKQAIDDDCNQTGQMLAALLDWPQGTFVSQLAFKDNQTIEVIREIDQGTETLSIELPAVVTTDLRLNQPRYPTLPNIMKAKQKPIEHLNGVTLGVEHQSRLQTISVEPPPVRQAGKQVKDVPELLRCLSQEGVI